ncbi:MAG: DUF3224 domain-containing protein [Gemmatimonadetes bacterium]|nr:DUF3224 domain-containing protein [Gemmatimonadota bacterium]
MAIERTASGSFAVSLGPMPPYHGDNPLLGRMSIDKTFEGDLVGTSRGEMLSARTPTAGSAGYVAIEEVTGSLEGRAGSFVLQHSSTMDRGVPAQSITVVPDSGTGELVGIAGRMTIEIKDRQHYYRFDYRLDR